MKQTYRKILAVILAASVVTVTGLLLTGCSEQKKDAEPTSATASETTAATEQQNNDASQVSTDGSAEQSDSDSESDSDGDTNESTASEATASTTSETTVSTTSETTVSTTSETTVSTTSETTVSTEQQNSAESQVNNDSSLEQSDSDSESDSDGYIDEATAIANVRSLVGSGAEIISSEKGYTSEGWAAWVIVVAPVTTSDGPETVTYYSGYQFCYPETSYRDNDTDTNTDIDSDGYIDQATAIANVKQQVGSGAEIISSEKGYTPEGWAAWVIVVAPVTASDNPETVTFYSGYQFCYRTDSAE